MGETYTKINDAAYSYDLTVKIWFANKGNKLVSEYSNTLKTWWQELDQDHSLAMDLLKGYSFSQKVCRKR